MKKSQKMSILAQEVAEVIEKKLSDCKDAAREGLLSDDAMRCVVETAVKTLDDWRPRLKYPTRCEVLDWFQSEYGICL